MYQQALVYQLCGKSSRYCHTGCRLWLREIWHEGIVHHWKGEEERKCSNKWVKNLINGLWRGSLPVFTCFTILPSQCLLLRWTCTRGSSNEVQGIRWKPQNWIGKTLNWSDYSDVKGCELGNYSISEGNMERLRTRRWEAKLVLMKYNE